MRILILSIVYQNVLEYIIDHGFNYLAGNPSDSGKRDYVRASLAAY
jgi:hypothetical protein